jgi:isopentenyl diphosphate isomerase/L-lactate dehydrogenase-like FMN-dependent dehydrogenase
VLVDSGFRRGTDVLKAITLGADAVSMVTLLMVAVAGNGRDGVRTMIEILNEELGRTMSYVGFPTIGDTDPSALRRIRTAVTARGPHNHIGVRMTGGRVPISVGSTVSRDASTL